VVVLSLCPIFISIILDRIEHESEMKDQHAIGDGKLEVTQRRRALGLRSALHWPALGAAGIGLALSLIAAYAVGRWEARVTEIAFDGAAKTRVIVLQNGINEYLSRLGTLRTLFESANDEITRSEFEVFSRKLFENHSGLLRVGWAPRVYRKERAEVEAAAIGDGVVGYKIKSLFPDGSVKQAPQSDEYVPIVFSTEPKTSGVYGFDYWSDRTRREALERARDNDIVTVVPSTKIWNHGKAYARGVLVSVPVYVKGTSRTTVADRRRNLTGFVVGVFELPQLLQSVLAATAGSDAVDIDVYSPKAGGDRGSEGQVAAEYSSAPQASRATRAPGSGLRWSGELQIGDANWQVVATPAVGGGLTTLYERALIVLAAGLIVTSFVVGYLGLASRNSRQLALANQRVLELARLDALTGLPNRAYFLDRLEQVEALERRGGGTFSVIMLDLDRFKNVNDSLGHAAGDALLREVASRLKSAIRDSDVVARLGGDEFAVIQTGCSDQKGSSLNLAMRIARLVAEPFQLPDHQVEVGTSIGIALAPEHGSDPHELMKKADLALYRSKSVGRNCFTLYDHAMSAELEARNTLESDLRQGIVRGELELHYQPVFEIGSGGCHSVEALVRWRHPQRGLIPPDQFIPLAEESGLIVPLGEWVLGRACRDATAWPADVKLAVNLSPVQFKQADLFDVIESVLHDSGLPPERLEIEVTESVLLEPGVENSAFMKRLKRLGVSLALDDFGTGYSSLSRLTAFPFDKIKIDRSFVSNLTKRTRSSAIISSVVTLARGLDMSVTAEGVETREQFELLRTLGVNFAQGYLLGRPVPISELKCRSELYPSPKMRLAAISRDRRPEEAAPRMSVVQG
jgi:diguanylate cyclase (GGDEF)-like protein